MPQPTPPFESIRDAILRDIRNQLPDADIGVDSDHYVRAAGAGAAIEGIYQHQGWLYRQIFPDTADTEALELHASDRGLSRKPAATASGAARVTGTTGAVVPAGTQLRHPNGTLLSTLAEAVIAPEGNAAVRVAAQTAGSAANGVTGQVTLTSPPIGVDTSAELIEALAGGADRESDAELLDRLLDLMRRPPAGGNRHDYQRWAREVPGVTAAYVYPLRRGLGTVDVVIVSATGLPSAELIGQVQQYIDERRPVTAWDCLVFGPTLITVDITAKVKLISGYTLEGVQDAATPQLAAALEPLAPGETLYRSHLEAVISGLAGVVDRELIQPETNLTPVVDASRVEWVRFGSVTLELLS
ncbi:baseplate J/gp47 family protein [Stenotrophomonas sp. B1-1]|uniref:baseplate J/gp47 family protein n=1 Tax=Stenotrophomonas sp. B1-1 TaxID=2710648 RepID=UPI0013DAE653|nr:baseplate J/gp47 family protein [Stenotrophomonas sp. B1-1]